MTVNAKMLETGKMEVEFRSKVLEFDAFQGRDGMEASYVFAAPVTRNGKDWPVSVIVKADGTAAVSYPSGLTRNHSGIRVTGFWSDSDNKSQHNKV